MALHQHWAENISSGISGHLWGSRRGPLGSPQRQSEEKKKLLKIASEGNRTKHGIPSAESGCSPRGVMFGKGMDVISVLWSCPGTRNS